MKLKKILKDKWGWIGAIVILFIPMPLLQGAGSGFMIGFKIGYAPVIQMITGFFYTFSIYALIISIFYLSIAFLIGYGLHIIAKKMRWVKK